jgi:hypothetical protein
MNNFKKLARAMVSNHIDFGAKGRRDLQDDPAAYYADIIINKLKRAERYALVAAFINEMEKGDRLDFISQSNHQEKIAALFTRFLSAHKQLSTIIDFTDYLADRAFEYHFDQIKKAIEEETGIFLRECAQNESVMRNTTHYAVN